MRSYFLPWAWNNSALMRYYILLIKCYALVRLMTRDRGTCVLPCIFCMLYFEYIEFPEEENHAEYLPQTDVQGCRTYNTVHTVRNRSGFRGGFRIYLRQRRLGLGSGLFPQHPAGYPGRE